MDSILYLKLGGSLLTDKQGVEAVRAPVLRRVASEIAEALAARPQQALILGHGSGSFGHVAAAELGSSWRSGRAWPGLTSVAAAAARLNRLVMEALLAEGVPALAFPPSAAAMCVNGRLHSLPTAPIIAALDNGLVPVVYGDVALDEARGGTIVSTEDIFAYLAMALPPTWLLLAGETDGVLDEEGQVIPNIDRENFAAIMPALGGSRGTDVTGGMLAKVSSMLELAYAVPSLRIRIFSGLMPGAIAHALQHPDAGTGTVIGTINSQQSTTNG